MYPTQAYREEAFSSRTQQHVKIMGSRTTLLTPTMYIASGEYCKQSCILKYCYRAKLKQLHYGNHYEQLNRKLVKLIKFVALSLNINTNFNNLAHLSKI